MRLPLHARKESARATLDPADLSPARQRGLGLPRYHPRGLLPGGSAM